MRFSVFILLLLMTIDTWAARPQSFILGGQYGLQFDNPTEFDQYVDQVNGILTTKIPHLSSAANLNIHAGYQVTDYLAFLVNYTRFSPWVSGNFGSTKLKASTETNIFMLDTKYTFNPEDIVLLYFKFGIGYAHYTLEEFVNSTSDSGSASSLAVKLGLGAEVPLSSLFSLSLESGYLFAKSNTLREPNGDAYSPDRLNMSGFYILAGFDFSIPFASNLTPGGEL